MHGSNRSRLMRAAGGTAAAGFAFVMGGCAVIGDGQGGNGAGDELTPAVAESDSVIVCHVNSDGTFSDVMVDGSTVVDRLAAGDAIGTCAQSFCGDS